MLQHYKMRLLLLLMMMSSSLLFAQADDALQRIQFLVEDAYFQKPIPFAEVELFQRYRLPNGAWQRIPEERYRADSLGHLQLSLQPRISYLLATKAEGYYLNHTPISIYHVDTALQQFSLSVRPRNYRPVELQLLFPQKQPPPADLALQHRAARDSLWTAYPVPEEGLLKIYLAEQDSHYFQLEHPDFITCNDSLYLEQEEVDPRPIALELELQESPPIWSIGDTLPLSDLYFKSGSKERLNSSDWPALREWLDSYGEQNLSLEIHTDARGSDRKNRLLAEARIAQLQGLFENWGFDLTRMEFEAVGESRLFNRCTDGVSCSEEEHQANNRLLIRVRE